VDNEQSVTTSPRERIIDAEPSDERSSSNAFGAVRSGWGNDALEWLRGKAELAWETRIQPLFAWLRGIFGRFGNGWGREVHIPERRMRSGGAMRVWSWDEQGVRMLKRVTRMLMLIAVGAASIVILAAAATRIASAVTQARGNISIPLTSGSSPTPNGGLTILNGDGNNATPVSNPTYTLGLWMSNNSPAVGQATTVYARVSNLSAPIAGAKVSFNVGGGTTTVTTDSYGIAALSVYSNGPGAVPVEIDGSVTVGGQKLTSSTFFTPI
jgi:hypothetical protein